MLEESNTAGNCTVELAMAGASGEEKEEKSTIQFVVGDHNLCKVRSRDRYRSLPTTSCLLPPSPLLPSPPSPLTPVFTSP